MSDSDGTVKVTDKRIFTPDGELREGYRHLDKAAEERPGAEPGPQDAAPETRAESAPEPEPRRPPAPDFGAERPEDGSRPTVFDLIAMIAEPVALFLGDAKLPDGSSAENHEMARFHIDLLEVIQAKTEGNLSAQESALLEDLLYRLRLRYVQKTS